MSSPSNLYAEKVYAEQPLVLWTLDDEATFASFFSTENLQLDSWTKVGGGNALVSVPDNTDPYAKISGSSFVNLSVETTDTGTGTIPDTIAITLTSPNTFSSSKVFSAGLWINPQTEIVSVKFTVGSMSKTFDMSQIKDEWIYLSHIFEPTSPVSNENFVIEIVTGISEIFLNGFSIGANQNNFGSQGVGVQLQSTGISGLYGYPTYEYGLSDKVGWYVGNNTSKDLYASNSSVPLVYGSDASTRIVENPSGPSLVIPGSGFLNKSKQSQVLAFEAWMRISADGSSQENPFRVFGPIGSSDGLYVNGQYLIIKVGNEFASHYVGEWYRPMLINIEQSPQDVILFVNGENVAKIDTDVSGFAEINNDYLGFYVGGGVSSIDIDCIAIYPYRITPVMSLRRFGYGQAVSLPSEIETAYSGKQIQIDYTFAGYSSDYSYPKIESWSSSTKENAYTNNNILSSTSLDLPDIQLSDTLLSDKSDTSKWESDMASANQDADTYPFIKMRPTSEWSSANVNGFFKLKTVMQKGVGSVKAVYAACEANADASDVDQVVMKIQNRETLDALFVVLSGTTLSYRYNIAGNQGSLGTKSVTSGSKFTAGINFVDLYNAIPGITSVNNKHKATIRTFLKARNQMSLFVGGDYSGSDQSISTTFLGKIYKFGMSSSSNYTETLMSGIFSGGLINIDATSSLMDKTGSYEVYLQKTTFGVDDVYKLSVAGTSYWQDYIPLSKFAKYADNQDGTKKYSTDMIQISIDAARSTTILDGKVDSSGNEVKSYVCFAYASDIANKISNFAHATMTKVQLDESLVIDARTSWEDKLFEFVDGAVILPPQSGFSLGRSQKDLVMITNIKILTKSAERLSARIRTLEYSAQTFNSTQTTIFDKNQAKKIGTRSQSSSMYMYAVDNGNYVYDSYNPVQITKSMSPYLYLTNKSGIKVLDAYSVDSDRGLYLQVNPDGSPTFKVSIISSYILFNDEGLTSPMSVMEIYDNEYSKIFLVLEPTEDPTVLKVKPQVIVNNVMTDVSGVEVFVNGVYSSSPTITIGQWASVAFLFPVKPLDFSGVTNFKIEITGSALVNNISYYQLRPEELAQQVLPNEWNDYINNIDINWDTIDDPVAPSTTPLSWANISASEQFVRPELSPAIISKIYNGSNRIVSVSGADAKGIVLKKYRYDIVNDIVWQNNITITP